MGSIVETAIAISHDPSTPNLNFYDHFEYIPPLIIPEEALQPSLASIHESKY